METLPASARRSPHLELRTLRFEDVPETLRLVARAVAFGCRAHYDAAQIAAVYAAYASTLFVEALGSYESVVIELDGRLAGFAQLDPDGGRLRALFVDAEVQGRGLGRALLAEIEARAGFRACGGEERLMSTGVVVPIVRMEKRLR